MSTYYGCTKAGIPYQRIKTHKFGEVVFKRILAVRKECVLCHEDFWMWPDRPTRRCATCQYSILSTQSEKE